ncbi:hypothetical protein SAMN02927930_01476 [Pseudidiomarina indica]|uniref:Uncharacterized protein n=1 Tax=Pseudidiomarina indica TaxID=1159017 RepID=A0A1G6CZU4_9GAMM|nr:hypothetical protein SAMN02927930_01476 [Pseudidiomarina indica]
MFNRPIESMT